jgi:hypothetical protein
MLHFLSSLFKASGEETGAVDKALVQAATERAVDGTDPRLRALGNYRKRLREPVTLAARHIIALVDDLPPAVEISRRAYGTDPRLRAFFVSAEHLQEVVGGMKSVRDFLQGASGPLPDSIFGLLTLTWKERTVLGTEQHGEISRRDVKQQAVTFFDHRFVSTAASEAEARWEMKKRGYDYLLKVALERILGTRGKRQDLKRERQLLNRKLEAMKAGGWGLEGMFARDPAEAKNPVELETQIEAVERELLDIGSDSESLQRSLDELAQVLEQPTHWLSRHELPMRLNYMGIRVAEDATEASSRLDLIELYSASGVHRILLPGYIPRAELPERPDFFKQAQRYLG